MANKTLIGETDYKISGSKTLIDGTAYLVESGKTLVGGTVYDIDLSNMLKMTVTWKSGGGWVDHSELGEEISDGTYKISYDSVLTCWIAYNDSIGQGYGAIYVNGNLVFNSYLNPYEYKSYEYIVTKNLSVTFDGDEQNCYIYITEE